MGCILTFDCLYNAQEVTKWLPGIYDDIVRLINSLLGDVCFDIISYTRYNEIGLFLNYKSVEQERINRLLLVLLKEIEGMVSSSKGVKVTLSTGGAYNSVFDVVNSRKEAHYAAWERLSQGNRSKFFFYLGRA
jgi:hypothetical protein